MLIEFKIQLDGTGAAKVTPAEAAVNPNAPSQKQLGTVFTPVAAGQKGGSAPLGDGPRGGKPTGVSASSGSGMVFVIGPIVISGSGPGETGLGGSAPLGDGPGGGPGGGNKFRE